MESHVLFCDAYLDIETTGLDPACSDITVLGLYLEGQKGGRIVQLIGDAINYLNLSRFLNGVKNIYTFNGSNFDLPFIKEKLGIDLRIFFNHCDLMYVCRGLGLYGGLKVVEKKLGIRRRLVDIDGRVAVFLWREYKSSGDLNCLRILLEYNREDVYNLKILRKKLEEIFREREACSISFRP